LSSVLSQKRAVLYTRVSTEEQAERNTSMETQREECLNQARRRNFFPVRICEDAGVSGLRYKTRPGIVEALRLIESGEASVLIILRLDRLGRSTKVILDIAERIDRAEGQIVTCDGMELGMSPSGKMMLTMLAAASELERGMIRERTMRGMKQRFSSGEMPSRSSSPYGYHIVTRRDIERGDYPADQVGKYTIVEEQARWVRCIFDRYASGQSLRQIANWLGLQGATTATGKTTWNYRSIKEIVNNSCHKGVAIFGKRETLHDENRITERNFRDAYRRTRPEEEWATMDIPAIVDPALWALCQAQLQRNKELLGGRRERRFMLTGLARCSTCGQKMTGGSAKYGKEGKKARFYTCRRGCKSKSYSARRLEGSVLQVLLWIAEQPGAIAQALKAYDDARRENSAEHSEDTRARLTAELKGLDSRAQAAAKAQTAALLAGAMEADFAPVFTEIAQRRAVIERELYATAHAPRRQEDRPEAEAEKLANVSAAIIKVLTAPDEAYSPAEKQALVSQVIDRVTPTAEEVITQLRSLSVHAICLVWYPSCPSTMMACCSMVIRPTRSRSPKRSQSASDSVCRKAIKAARPARNRVRFALGSLWA
jgi:site-specific DNA recombinase